ncbi:MAG: UvrD-helicase domain-containing protein [Polyangiales bacterium]
MSKLNPSQSAAVEHHRGPLLVLAGAGSGKTRVITHRIARLIERGIRPEQILAVSFTNKASLEMAERMSHIVGPRITERIWLSTFHSFGVRFLGEENRALGYEGRFVIFDQGDCSGLIKDLVRRVRGGDRSMDTGAVLTRISLWKNAFLSPEQIPISSHEYDEVAREVYPLYEKTLSNMHAFDFDDLVVAPVRILEKREDIRAKWQRRFTHLLIDEFQDTNKSQLELVRLLANEDKNVCVVGDDDQSIYGWRGAEVGNILDFERHFPGATIIKLEENYRSREPILAVANAAISRSRGKRHDKQLVPTRLGGDRVRLCQVHDAVAEARLVAKEIKNLRAENIAWKDMAVLYRSNQQAKLVEEELRAEGIPYRMFGGTQFFDRKEIKDAVAYLRVVVHPDDDLSLRRIANYPPRGLGDTSLDRVSAFALRHDLKLEAAFARADEIEQLPENARRGAKDLVRALRRARESFRTGASPLATTRHLLEEVGVLENLKGLDGKDGERRRDNLEFLLRSLQRYEENKSVDKPSVAQFLTRITLRFEGDEEETGNRVTLSSLHSAKGLEYDYVFLIGCVEGYLPHSRTTDPKITEAIVTDVDEERRLFYVGVTRAKERLYLSWPTKKQMRGRIAPYTPSRFLDGLPEEWCEHFKIGDDRPMEKAEVADMAAQILAKLRGGSGS